MKDRSTNLQINSHVAIYPARESHKGLPGKTNATSMKGSYIVQILIGELQVSAKTLR